jgi:hypothetical protein
MSTFHDYSNSASIIASLCALDAEYDTWVAQLPPQFFYEIRNVPVAQRTDELFGEDYHVYNSVWIATVWNHYRCVRILVNEILVDQISYILQSNFGPFDTINLSEIEISNVWGTDSSTTNNFPDPSFYSGILLNAASILDALPQDICASVPYYLSTFTPSSSATPPKTVVGNLLLWPLYAAAVTPYVSDELRTWVARRLSSIAETMGIRQAAPLAEALMTTLDLDTLEWEVDERMLDIQREANMMELEGGDV